MIKFRTEKIIDVSEWDDLVRAIYKKPYCFQQQAGCRPICLFRFKVPDRPDDFQNESVPEVVNGEEMGVSFEAWKARDPKKPLSGGEGAIDGPYSWQIDMWWERNFYPDFQMVANDLHKKGLLKAGEYTIEID